MTTHKLKLREEYADAVLTGDKCFEVRLNDRGFQKGDEVIFNVIDNTFLNVPHALNHFVFEITYLVHGFGLEKDWCVFGIRRKEHE